MDSVTPAPKPPVFQAGRFIQQEGQPPILVYKTEPGEVSIRSYGDGAEIDMKSAAARELAMNILELLG